MVLQFRTIRNSTVAINDQWLLLKPELLWLLIVNALQLNELSALRNTFYPEYKYTYTHTYTYNTYIHTYIHTYTYNVARASKRNWGQGLTKCNNDFYKGIMLHDTYLRATRGARNPNLQVFITHALHVCSQHSFGLPLRMYGMHRTHFDHVRLDLLPLLWSRVFWPSLTWNLRKAKRWSKSVLTFDCYRLHPVTSAYF